MASMWRIVAVIVWAIVVMRAQPPKDLLLPKSRHMVGFVVDSGGKPVARADIDHANDPRQAYQTDSNGRFELDTRAPSVVIRKLGFQSEFVLTQDAMDLRITLQKVDEKRPFPSCSKTRSDTGLDGWGAAFVFPEVRDVKASRQQDDVDYGARSYYVETKSGPKSVTHASGPMWSSGTPSDQDVWRSVKYQETTYDFGGSPIIDARGQLSNGLRWRHLGKFGESASYSDLDEATAKILDSFLDGACATSISIR
jgi:hypothetical protein